MLQQENSLLQLWRISYDKESSVYCLHVFPITTVGTAACLCLKEKSLDNFSGNNWNRCLTSLAHLFYEFCEHVLFFHTLLWASLNALRTVLFSCQQVAVILLLKAKSDWSPGTRWALMSVTGIFSLLSLNPGLLHLSILLPGFAPSWNFTRLWKQWLLYPCVMLISCLAYASSRLLHPLFQRCSCLSLGGNLQCDAVIFMLSVNLH